MDVRFAANGTNWGRPGGWTADDLDDWRRYLDEVAAAGFDGIEHAMFLAPHIDVETLGTELERRGLVLAGLLCGGALETPEGRQRVVDQLITAAAIVNEIGADYLGVIDALVFDASWDPAGLDPVSWEYLIETMQLLNERSRDLCGLPVLLHPHEFSHVDSLGQVERFLRDTESAGVPLLFDTGHIAYRGGDPVDFYVQHRDRIGQIHLKNVDRSRIPDQPTDGVQGLVATGAFSDLTTGDVDFEALGEALGRHGYQGWLTIEMSRHPPQPDRSLDMARKALDHLRRIGFGKSTEGRQG